MRGGTVNCEVVMSDDDVSEVNKADADFIVALNQASFDKFVSKIKTGGWIIVNSTLAKESKPRNDINYLFAPITQLAENVGNVKNDKHSSLGSSCKSQQSRKLVFVRTGLG